MLAHITPKEAALLKRRGGSGTINPDTGLPEFEDDTFGGGDMGYVAPSIPRLRCSKSTRSISTYLYRNKRRSSRIWNFL
jgi:hypothetical protein